LTEPRPRKRKGALAAHLAEPEKTVASGTATFVVGPYPARKARSRETGSTNLRDPEARLDEAAGLARAIDLDVVGAFIVTVDDVRPATYLGKGKVEELAGTIKASNIGLVVMDCALSPVQQRNLERAWGCKVIDRTGLILEIFGRRARTREGALQVELAHLAYQKSRLVRSWTHLERQRGGFGFLGGPGETQIEADRRIIQDRMTRIERELEQVKRTRSLHRAGRRRVPYPVVALVGYTNAGKSTLFNRLTTASVMAEDMLFATLDPTARAITLPHGEKAILSDTVGFISDLPTMLVAAFRATLEDVVEADVLLHVRDVSHEDTDAQAADVENILRELGIDEARQRNLIEVWNKADLLDEATRERLAALAARKSGSRQPVLVSAQTGYGIDTLLAEIEARIAAGRPIYRVELAPTEGATLNWLYEEAEILKREEGEDGHIALTVRLSPEKESRLTRRCPGARRAAAA
jgi:GTP-binding protein HflX